MKNYIQKVVNDKGFEINPEALVTLDYVLTSYIEHLTQEALEVAQFHNTLSSKPVDKIYDSDLDLLLEFQSKRIIKETISHVLHIKNYGITENIGGK